MRKTLRLSLPSSPQGFSPLSGTHLGLTERVAGEPLASAFRAGVLPERHRDKCALGEGGEVR